MNTRTGLFVEILKQEAFGNVSQHVRSHLENTHTDLCAHIVTGHRDHPKVVAEMAASSLCSDLDFSDPEAYCSHISPPEVLQQLESDRVRCAKKRQKE